MDIKNMCCNTFGDRDKIQKRIDELQIELNDQREAANRLYKILTPEQRKVYYKETLSLKKEGMSLPEASHKSH